MKKRPVATLVPDWRSGRPARRLDDPEEQLRHYTGWVYAAVRAIADGVSSQRLRFFGPEGEILRHPAVELFKRVNPFATYRSLMQETVSSLELTGNAFWYAPPNSFGAPAEIWHLPPNRVKVVPHKTDFIAGYILRGGDGEVKLSRDEVVHLRYPNPSDPFYGRSPLQAAAEAVDADEAMSKAQVNAFTNSIFPGLALASEHKLSRETIDRLRRELHRTTGSYRRAGTTLILDQGLRPLPLGRTPQEMNFLASARATAARILAVFGVPEAIVGVSKDVNRASAQALEYIFARYTLWPKMQLLSSQVTQDLCARFDPALRCEFDSPVPADGAERRADMVARLEHGVITVNEARAALGMAPMAPVREEE